MKIGRLFFGMDLSEKNFHMIFQTNCRPAVL